MGSSLTYGDDLYAIKTDVQGLGSEFTIPSGYDDTAVKNIISRASKLIDMQTANHFGNTPMVITVSGSGTPILSTRQVTTWPIVSVSEVLERADFEDEWTDSDVETIATKYWFISRSRRALVMVGEYGSSTTSSRSISDKLVWTKAHKNYRITGKFGRKTVPEVIKWACVLLSRELMSQGWIADNVEQMKSERHADGYSYVRQIAETSGTSRSMTRTTGHPFVDSLLAGYSYTMPSVIVPGRWR